MIHKTFPIAEQLLAKGLQSAQSLHLQLLEEMNILKHNLPVESLDDITPQKQQLVSELNLFSKQLGQVLETEQLTNDRHGISAYFDKADSAGITTTQALKNWQQLVDIANKSRTLNDQNGASIDLLLRRTRQSLNILKGKPQTAHTYGRDGSTQSALFSGTLISV
ncbi:MAG: flagellar protein FlgN [Gammaproteobacteria bacterium HGW-Gammaproteobacteria-3]|jgi:flagella synthesis protein FlgN|nr:MAG: flagellar protein FlgN [Gammaproteobacteria bacterium HGW-Gammaproteobacteria-3]